MRTVLPLLLAALLAACDGTSGNAVALNDAVASPGPATRNAAMPAKAPSRHVPPWDASQCGDDEYQNARMERHPALMGRSADDLLAAYGKPHAESSFRAGEGVGTYSGGVASQLPGGAARNAHTQVREIIWQRDGCSFIVRFREHGGDWRVFDAFEASADADF
jgi:hypothetical protein